MSAIRLHRVVSPAGVLPQAAERLDASPSVAPDEVRVRVERLNLDAASYRQLSVAHGGDGDAVRAAVLEIVAARGKMHNPVTGSGGMLVGVVDGGPARRGMRAAPRRPAPRGSRPARGSGPPSPRPALARPAEPGAAG